MRQEAEDAQRETRADVPQPSWDEVRAEDPREPCRYPAARIPFRCAVGIVTRFLHRRPHQRYRLLPDCVVAELMSIHRENHVVESQKLLRPHVVVVTNVGLDHTDAMGDTRDEVASVLAECLTPGSDVFVPETERLEPPEAMARRRGARTHAVPSPPRGS